MYHLRVLCRRRLDHLFGGVASQDTDSECRVVPCLCPTLRLLVAVDYVHRVCQRLHLDIKPVNILLSEARDQLYVADLGISQVHNIFRPALICVCHEEVQKWSAHAIMRDLCL